MDPLELQKLQEQKRRQRAKKKAESRRTVRTPEPVLGRKHIDVQTDLYLEELSDKVPEAIAMTQTDAFINRAPSPLYIPQKSGLDVATQIYDGELFDFNIEVMPILDVIVGKTLEQALMEVNEENELEAIRAHHVLNIPIILLTWCSANSKKLEMRNMLKSSDWKMPNVVEQKKKSVVSRNKLQFKRKRKKLLKKLQPELLLKVTFKLLFLMFLILWLPMDTFSKRLKGNWKASFYLGCLLK